jgi:hypothetical protein
MQVKNLAPAFTRPNHQKSLPSFLKACNTMLTKRPASAWDGWQLIRRVHGKSLMNTHRASAINAIFIAIANHVDLNSSVVFSNVYDLAHATGLATVSIAGNVSITRCSRAIIEMERAGFIETELVWDRVLGCHIPKFINVTDLFWEIAHPEGATGYHAAREKQIVYQSQGIAAPEQWLTVSQAKENRRRMHIKTAFKLRREKHEKSKQRTAAKKLTKGNIVNSRGKIGKEILDELGSLHGLTTEAFQVMISQRYALYNKIAADPDQPRH